MPKIWAYDLSHPELLERLRQATARAGVSNSGLIMDLTGSNPGLESKYLEGVALSRLEGKQPPYKRGDKVRICSNATYYCGSENRVRHGEHSSIGEAKPGVEYEVVQVFYEEVYRAAYEGGKQYIWTVSFKNKEDPGQEDYRFDARRFQMAKQAEPASA